jgi:serine/threonine-protein kinase
MIGRTLGNYRVVEQIGMGGMATVFKAYDPNTDRYVAIKVLPPQFSTAPTFRERFQREAKAIANLEHIHILPIFGYGEEDGIAYMVMRYLQTGTLSDRIKQGPLPLPEAARLLTQIAEALDYAHSCHILHRDVKPKNVLLDGQTNAFLTDFGIAKIVENAVDLTGTGILGTPAYMSPEQCRGSKMLTPATDQYSLGIVLYEMVTGRTPYQAETPIALIYMQLNDPLPMPNTIRPDLPDEAQRVILKALAKEPNTRYPSCRDFAAAFSLAIGLPPPAATISPPPDRTLADPTDTPTLRHQPPPALKPAPPRWIWAIAVAAIVLALLAGGGLFVLLSKKEPPSLLAGTTSQTQPAPPSPTAQPARPTATPVAPPPPTAQGEVVPHPPAAKPPVEALKLAYQLWPNISIEPCPWQDSGSSGLCLFTWSIEVEHIRILADSGLEFLDAPGFSPDGKQIVFSAAPINSEDTYAESNIYIVNSTGANLIELPLPGSQVAPVWSPTGDWLAFGNDGHLAIMRPNGDDRQNLLNLDDGQCVNRPQWSPDSQSIVVSVQDPCEDRLPLTRHIWLVADRGQTVTPLITTVYNNRDCVDFATAFTPDGQQVAYIDSMCQTQQINVDGSGEPTQLQDFPWSWRSNTFPAWQELLFTDRCEYLDEGGPGVCLHSNTRNLSRILADNSFDLDRGGGPFSWSPDGRQLVFSTAKPDAPINSLYTINFDGSGLQQLPLPENAVEPVWSPDGEWLAFHYVGNVAIAHPDGSGLTVLHKGQECVSRLGWSPDSQLLVASMKLDPPGCDYEFPQTRGVWLISPTTGETAPWVEITYPRECDNVSRVAINHTGQYLAYFNAECQPVMVNRNDPGQAIDLPEFPWWWENYVYPQWGGVADQPITDDARCPSGQIELFFDDFENGLQNHWNTFPGEAGKKTDLAWEIGAEGNNHFLVGKQHHWAVTGSPEWKNYVFHLQLRRTQTASDAHLNIYLGDGTRYMLHLKPGPFKRDNRKKGETDKFLAQAHYTPDTEWHEFSLAAIGDHLEIQLDGQTIAAYTDPDPLPGGPVGLENISGVIWYDNILVCGLP